MLAKTYHKLLFVTVLVFYVWTLYGAVDYFIWCLEIFPAVIGGIVIFSTYRRFPLSNLSYTLIAIHTIILAYGGRTTYAEAPLGYWLSDVFDWERNNYDKIGHFMQGFGPAIWGREILIRLSPLGTRQLDGKYTRWLSFLTVSTALAFSALYEFIEWWIAILSPSAGDDFLGTQGYIWDTQSDMLLALIGAIVAYIFLWKVHNKSISHITYSIKST